MIRKRKRKAWERDIASKWYRETRDAYFTELGALKALSERSAEQALQAARELTLAQMRASKARQKYLAAVERERKA